MQIQLVFLKYFTLFHFFLNLKFFRRNELEIVLSIEEDGEIIFLIYEQNWMIFLFLVNNNYYFMASSA